MQGRIEEYRLAEAFDQIDVDDSGNSKYYSFGYCPLPHCSLLLQMNVSLPEQYLRTIYGCYSAIVWMKNTLISLLQMQIVQKMETFPIVHSCKPFVSRCAIWSGVSKASATFLPWILCQTLMVLCRKIKVCFIAYRSECSSGYLYPTVFQQISSYFCG